MRRKGKGGEEDRRRMRGERGRGEGKRKGEEGGADEERRGKNSHCACQVTMMEKMMMMMMVLWRFGHHIDDILCFPCPLTQTADWL